MRIWLPPVLQLEASAPVLVISLDWCAHATHWLAAGLNDGTLAVWDLREKAEPHSTSRRAAEGSGGKEDDGGAEQQEREEEEGCEGGGDGDGVGVGDGDGGGGRDGGTGRVAGGGAGGLDGEETFGSILGAPLGVLTVPHAMLGCSSRLGGNLSRLYTLGSTRSSQALGHAGPVMRVRWAPPPHELLASVGQDGLLIVWDHCSRVPIRQLHQVSPYTWATDALWAPSDVPAIFVATDCAGLKVQELRDDIVAPRCIHARACILARL